jgi:hypothetical protein
LDLDAGVPTRPRLARSGRCAILRDMTTSRRSRPFLSIGVLLLAVLATVIAGCGPVADVIGQREPPTPTSRPFSTATPGGRLSVWMVTPTGQVGPPVTPTPAAVGGNPVGPNATATAAIATIQAATQAAAAPPPAPNYQPNECPAPAIPPPPPRPQEFGEYSVVIGRYLSAGGARSPMWAGWSRLILTSRATACQK